MSAAALRNINCAENKIQDDIDQRLFLKPTGPKKTRTRGPIILEELAKDKRPTETTSDNKNNKCQPILVQGLRRDFWNK